MKSYLLVLLLLMTTSCSLALGAERAAQRLALEREYENAVQEFQNNWLDKSYLERNVEDRIHIFEDWPAWKYIPRFLELARVEPSDDTAFECCLWIIEQTGNVGNDDQQIFSADQRAWAILSAHHTQRPDLPKLCFMAANCDGPAQEQFLRALILDPVSSRESKGFATLALAELLAQRHENSVLRQRTARFLEKRPDAYASYLINRKDAAWKKYISKINPQDCKEESIRLFRQVLREYNDIPVTISEPSFRNLADLGEKASKSLHALKNLSVGSKAPNIAGVDLNGQPLDLQDYRGNVVVLSFWFPECGPCIALVPQEKKLIEKYEGKRFTLLGVCRHEDRVVALNAANEHQMDWPCWYDGPKGPIVRDWNILRWPTVCILDQNGVIVAKDIQGTELDGFLEELMREGG